MKDNIELVRALLDGKVLEIKGGYDKVFIEKINGVKQPVRYSDGLSSHVDPFDLNPTDWIVSPIRKKITDRYKLMATVGKWIREGKLFYVKRSDCETDWCHPWQWNYLYGPEQHTWTYYDEHTGQPIGEPQDFLEEDE